MGYARHNATFGLCAGYSARGLANRGFNRQPETPNGHRIGIDSFGNRDDYEAGWDESMLEVDDRIHEDSRDQAIWHRIAIPVSQHTVLVLETSGVLFNRTGQDPS